MALKQIIHYFDYKSPYAYLAQEETFGLERDFDVQVDWLPYTLDIPQFMGAAEVDDSGRVISENRNAHQWRRVRYSYMDSRREASRRGLVVRGPRKIFDSSIAHIGMLYAKHAGDFRAFHAVVYERFWKRKLNIEDLNAITRVLEEVGIDASGFPAYLSGAGRQEHDRIQAQAHDLGVFGVPSYVVDGQLFWGAERLVRVHERLREEE
ncbi:MAG: DsbA family protein [Candidatus Binatia bacterium]